MGNAEPLCGIVVILAPTGRDAEAAALLLGRDGLACRICTDLDALCESLGEPAGVVLIAEEALAGAGLDRLTACLGAQPPWSDLPFIVLTCGTLAARRSLPKLRLADTLGNVMLLERPLHAMTLVSAVRTALRARRRQYQLRDHLREREQSAEALRASEAEFRATFEVAAVGKAQADPQTGRFLRVNSALCAMTSYAQEELLGLSLPEITHPEDREADAAAFRRLVGGEAPTYESEQRYICKDGRTLWVSVSAMLLRDAAGRPQRISVVIQDVSARREAEEQLRRSEERFRTLAETLPQLVWTTGPDGHQDWFNRRWYDYTGVTPGQTDGDGWSDLLHPGDRERTIAVWQRSLETGELYKTEHRIRGKDGAYRWFLSRARPMQEGGRIVRWFGTCTDISDIVEARETLARGRAELEALVVARTAELAEANRRLTAEIAERRRAEETYRTLYNKAPVAQHSLDAERRIQWVSDVWLEFLGYERAEVLDRPITDFLTPAAAAIFARLWPQFLAAGEIRDVALEFLRKSGEAVLAEVSSRLERDADGRFLRTFAAVIDITGRRAAERALEREAAERQRAEAALLQAQKMEAVGQMTGGVAHDFNNLLTVIVGNLDLIERAAAANPARVRALASAAMTAANRGERLTQQLLAFARRQTLRPELVNASHLIRDFAGLIRRAVGEAIELRINLDAALAPCRVDPAQFEAAILNLAVNARDAMAGGGRITIETRNVALGSADTAEDPEGVSGPYVLVAVGDTGSGIPPDVLARVFEPFFTTKDVGKGSGLGLSQVYGFVKQSGGHVRIDSAVGVGTTVRIYLPRTTEPASEVAAVPSPLAEAVGARGESVLVVEDDPDVLAIAVAVLRELGFRVHIAHDALEALDILKGPERIDLVFTDVVMPRGLNGADVAAEACRLRPGIKVLLTSGYTAQALTEDHKVGGVWPILGKPYRRADLAAAIYAALAGPPAAALPVEPPATAPLPGACNASPSSASQPGDAPLRVLVVEDDALVRLATVYLIEGLGHSVIDAPSAEAALELMEASGDVDVLFTDVGLPGMNGTMLAVEARRRKPDLKVVVATGYADARAGAPADDGTVYLGKPYRSDEVGRILKRLRSAVAKRAR